MHIKRVHLSGFRRFTDLLIEIPTAARLVVLCGPNGTGKSAIFDAFRAWHVWRSPGGSGFMGGNAYWVKGGEPATSISLALDQVVVTFHEGDIEHGTEAARRAFYFRTAHRNDPEFSLEQITRAGPIFEADRTTGQRSIDNDARVTTNYQRMVALAMEALYTDTATADELRERYVAHLRDAMRRLFPDLVLIGPGNPLDEGTFTFKKGAVDGFRYMNLSGGEKAAFDLLLDLVVKRDHYNDTIVCIDEPEAHINPRVQGDLLRELLLCISEKSQLWVATHSVGMLRFAQELPEDDVVFLDLQGEDFDASVTLTPEPVSRAFWQRTLEVALGDFAALVAPQQIVLCEGKPVAPDPNRSQFDARCYRAIFSPRMADVEFYSIGNDKQVEGDSFDVGHALTTLVRGAQILRVLDRDDRTEQERAELAPQGIRVLRRRHLESYLLDDEVLTELCASVGQPEKVEEVLAAKQKAFQDSVANGNPPDDAKSAAGRFFVEVRRILGLRQHGNSASAFLEHTLVPLLRPGMTPYDELREDIFGSPTSLASQPSS